MLGWKLIDSDRETQLHKWYLELVLLYVEGSGSWGILLNIKRFVFEQYERCKLLLQDSLRRLYNL